MKCDDARFAVAADPSHVPVEVAGHLERCARCAAYAQDMRRLDDRLRQAMAVPVPRTPHAAPAVPATAPPARWRTLPRLALAASVAGVALLVGLLWVGVPGESLAAGVAAHMAHEPYAWQETAPASRTALARALDGSGVRLRDGFPEVTYANRCWFRGRHVPHLVVQTTSGPVTVMVLPHQEVAARQSFDEDGYHGVLLPAARGSIALLSRAPAAAERASRTAAAAIEYVD